MNKIQTIINAVLAAAVVALFILVFVPRKPKTISPEEVLVSGEHMPIAFVNSDSILAHYTFAIEADEKLNTTYEESSLRMDDKARAFQREYETFQREAADFQHKVEAGAFLSQQRAESEQARLQQKQERLLQQQQELETLQAQLRDDFMQQQQDLTAQLQDSVQSFLREYNSDGRYHLIVNDAIVLNKVGGYDITNEVIEGLNARYNKD